MPKPNFLLFGHENNSDISIKLETLSVVGSAEKIRALGFFFLQCAAEMEAYDQWDHKHFNDSGLIKGGAADVDIICMLDKLKETRK